VTINGLGNLGTYRHLLFMLTWRDIRLRYKQTVMGFAWALLMPALIVVAGILVKKALAVARGGDLDSLSLASVSLKALPWAFFVGSVRFATTSLTSNTSLLTKVYFPRQVLPLSAVLAHLFDFGVAAVVLGVVLAWLGVSASIHLLWVPVLLALLVAVTAGCALLLACANLFFRDVKYMIEAGLTVGIFFTPVFYDARMLGEWGPVLLLNPIGALLEALNDAVILRTAPDPFWVLYAATWAIGGYAAANAIFHRAEPMFAERV
jgi:ABC-type polysaccharide/polyol phosphate export permease